MCYTQRENKEEERTHTQYIYIMMINRSILISLVSVLCLVHSSTKHLPSAFEQIHPVMCVHIRLLQSRTRSGNAACQSGASYVPQLGAASPSFNYTKRYSSLILRV